MDRLPGDIDPLTVLEAASESIIVTTADLDPPGPVVVYANPAFERMTGWTAAEIRGKSPRVLQGGKTDLSIFSDMRRVLLGGGRWEGQAVNYRKDGSEFVMEWSITPVLDAKERPEYFVAVQRDVTARLAAERQIAEAREAAFEADRRKVNLARYFSPGMAELLAERDSPLGKVRRQNVAVLIIDIVGFTALSEKLPPERVVALLRSFYRRMATIIFDHGGSIENFSGDALLAVFGVPDAGPHDGTNAIRCAMRMLEDLGHWNKKRLAAGRDKIDVGISAHYGLVVLGDIGTRQSMSFTTIGDTVNVTSRLQELCRSIRVELLVTEDLIRKARRESRESGALLAKFINAGAHAVRGRSQPIRVLTIDKSIPRRSV